MQLEATCIIIIFATTVLCSAVSGFEYGAEHRIKRFSAATLASAGMKAVKKLLTGAILLKNDPPKLVKYVKFGGINGARREVGSVGDRTMWTDVITNRGKKFGKIVGDRFIEILPATNVYPPMVRVSKIRLLEATRKTAELEQPIIEIKYAKRRPANSWP